MKVIAAIQADLETTPLGTRSRAAQEIGGVPLLRRTVEQLRRARHLAGVYVLAPVAQEPRCAGLVASTGAEVRRYDAPAAPWADLVRSARKWSLDGWRGGIGGSTWFDEYVDCRLLSGLLKMVEADAVLAVPSAAPLLSTALADRMIEHRRAADEDVRLIFTQAVPGIAGVLLDASLVHEVADKGVPIGWVFTYQPDNPRKDLIFLPCCVEIPPELRYATGRLIADTDRATARVAAILHEHADPDLPAIGRWLTQREAVTTEPLPREVEIELTTDDPYPEGLLRPRGGRVPQRGPIDVEVVRRVADELAAGGDDSLVVLGGFGDPLRHPRLPAVLEALRAPRAGGRRVCGVALRTTGVDLTDEVIAALVEHQVDVLMVSLDAWTPDLYGRLQSPQSPAGASLERVRRRMERVAEVRQQQRRAAPIVVAEMVKARENVHELEAFYDGWIRRVGAVCITGHGHLARQCDDHSVTSMAPAARFPCRRIRARCVVLADARVTLCDQDLHGRYALGSLHERSLGELWSGEAFEQVRLAHRAGRFDPLPLCAACDEWHRP
ncbi:MAG: SPASM domain-containing protein [Planctomycetes bacterium]|nr:SPASM domain-containing protein [Planctomycetota bacterium]